MEDRPYFAFRREIKESGLLFFIVVFAAAIRLYHSFHPFISDEAFNLITIERLAVRHEFDDYFFRHSPLYLLTSTFFSWLFGQHPYIPSFVSVVFSSLAIVPFFFMVKSLSGRSVALCSCAILSVIPANLYYSGWIKQEGMLIFFFMWALFFYLKGSYWVAGILCGLALLTKEFAIFFFPLSFFTAIFKDKGEEGSNSIIGWFKTVVTAGIVSSWWYLGFGATFYKITGEALIGGNMAEFGWHSPWWFYLKNLPHDLSYPVFSLFMIGLVFIVREASRGRFQLQHAFPLFWIAVLYLPLSAVVVKAPWYIYLSTPAFAFLAAFGLKYIAELVRPGGIRPVVTVVLILLIVSSLFTVKGESFYVRVFPFPPNPANRVLHGATWEEMEKNRDMWRRKIGGRGKVGLLEPSPAFTYLAGISSQEIVLMRVSEMISLDRAGLLNKIKSYGIKVFIINADSLTYSEKNLEDMTSIWGEPERIGTMLVFKEK